MKKHAVPQHVAVVHDHLPLLEVADAVTLDHLLLDPAVAQAIVQRIAPTVALVDPLYVETLAARLKALGHLPKVVTS